MIQPLRTIASFRRLRRVWSGLGKAERRASLLGVVAIPTMAAGARIFGFGRMRDWAAGVRPRFGAQRAIAEAEALARGTRRAARRGFYPGTCLPQSLTLLWLMRREGLDAEIVLGARLVNGQLEAHAWVECDRIPINDGADVRTRFAPLESST